MLGKAYNIKSKKLIQKASNGLSYALLEVPYGLRYNEFIRQKARKLGEIKKSKKINLIQTKFFNHFLEEIGLEITDETQLIIYEWSNDWSYYFDAGKEWWGTFFWTILKKEKREIIVICASTTD